MNSHDRDIIGRAFTYYNDREDRKGSELDVKDVFTLTEGGLLGTGGIYEAIQWRRTMHDTNNAILNAIFWVLKNAVQDPTFAEKLVSPDVVHEEIEYRLGKFKGQVIRRLHATLQASPDLPSPLTPHDECMHPTPSTGSIEILSTKHTASLGDKTVTSQPVSKDNPQEKPSIDKRRRSHRKPPIPKEIKRIFSKKKNGGGKEENEKDSFIRKKYYADLFNALKITKHLKDKITICRTIFLALQNDFSLLGIEYDSKITGYSQRILRALDENTCTDDLIFELKFYYQRLEILKKK